MLHAENYSLSRKVRKVHLTDRSDLSRYSFSPAMCRVFLWVQNMDCTAVVTRQPEVNDRLFQRIILAL